MVFEPGSNVEVWTRREVPSGSWRIAEIVSGNGITFSVRFYGYPKGSRVAVDRVPWKAIRPFPPEVGGLDQLISGDVVEVLDRDSWKLAEVSRLDNLFCYARLLGTSRELQVPRAETRLRLAWHDNRWTLIHNDSGKPNNRMMLSTAARGLKRRAPGMPRIAVEMDDEGRRKMMKRARIAAANLIPDAPLPSIPLVFHGYMPPPPSSAQMAPPARNVPHEASDSDSDSDSVSTASRGSKRRSSGIPGISVEMCVERRRKMMMRRVGIAAVSLIPAALQPSIPLAFPGYTRPLPSSAQMQPAARNMLRTEASGSDSESISSSVGSCSVGTR